MIFRAVFWIGLVSLLTPHEPDLGLGRPGAGIALPAIVKSWAVIGLSRPGVCDVLAEPKRVRGAPGGALGPAPKSPDGHRLAAMKEELDASIKARRGVL